jgi:hypothetical protein
MTHSVRPTKFCQSCGAIIDALATQCPVCGQAQPLPVQYGGPSMPVRSYSSRRLLPAVILCGFFGVFGVHRFYMGKIGTGILQLLTAGGLGIWWMIDLIMLVIGRFRDKDGELVTEWT